MPTIDDLPRLLQDDEQVRNDFLATWIGFMQRHGITASDQDLKGVELSDDARGYLSAPSTLGTGGLVSTAPTLSSQFSSRLLPGTGGVSVIIATEGDSRSRVFIV